MKYLPSKHKSDIKENSSISGQALLLVLLVLAVVLTLVLSVVSRSITDVSLTTRDEESLRAFSAAEAGVERMIVGGGGSGVLNDESSYEGVIGYGRGTKSLNFPEIESGESITIWFVEHDEVTGNLTCDDVDNDGIDDDCYGGWEFNVCWGNNDSTTAPAIEVSYYYDTNNGNPSSALTGDFSGVKVARAAYDSLSRDNSFSKPAETACDPIDNVTYKFRTGDDSITTHLGDALASCTGIPGCLLFAKVKMFYNDVPHGVGVIVDEPLPSQGRSIESTGSSGDATAKIKAFQSYNEPLDIFESALFSKSALVKPEN